MSNWYVGQRVVAVRSVGWLVSGRIYELSGVATCRCGRVHLTYPEGDSLGQSRCPACNDFVGNGSWDFDTSFRPLDTLDEAIERLEAEGNVLLRELELIEQ